MEEIDHREVVVTREPGGTVIGEDIRHLLMHADSSKNIFPETELLLFAASRAQLVREIIFPSVQDGKIVLCDRFLDSIKESPVKSQMIQSLKLMLLRWEKWYPI